jgi:DNA-binding HxlR family transcriptional regulator
MALLDLLGRRWQLRVLWELRTGPLTFRALRERCEAVSPTILNRRLGELREAGVVELEEGAGYALTRDGSALLAALGPVAAWADRWSRRPSG